MRLHVRNLQEGEGLPGPSLDLSPAWKRTTARPLRRLREVPSQHPLLGDASRERQSATLPEFQATGWRDPTDDRQMGGDWLGGTLLAAAMLCCRRRGNTEVT